MLTLLDLAALRAQPLVREPYDHIVVRHFLPEAAASAVCADFPDIAHPGVLPAEDASCGPGLAALLDELRSPAVSAAFSETFGVDLTSLPLMVTLRGRCRSTDGKIHADSESKVVTALLYLNESWDAPGGRLRLLRRPDDLDDYAAEVPPLAGTLLAFRRTDRSWHGHLPYEGARRCVMFNWMTGARVAGRELLRHRLSARVKRWTAPVRGGQA